MRKTLKIAGILLALLIVLLIAGILLLPTLANTDTFRQQLIQQVKQHTGQTLTIQDELKLSVFPWLGIHTGQITLSQPAGITPSTDSGASNTSDNHLLQISSVDIGVKLLPLLQKKLEVRRIELKQPKLHYIVTKDGKSSLDGIAAQPEESPSPQESATKSESPQAPNQSPASLAAIVIAGISITEGELIYDDFQSGEQHRIQGINLETGNLLSKKEAPINLSATVTPHQVDTVSVSLKALSAIDINNGSVTLKDIATALKQTKSGQTLNADIALFRFDQQTQLLNANQLIIKANNGEFSPQLSIPEINVSLQEYQTSMFPFSLTEQTLGVNVDGEMILKDWHNDVMAKGKLSSNEINPQKILQALAVDYSPTDKTALQKMAFSTKFSGSLHGMALHAIDLTLDDSSLAGDVSLMGFEQPHYHFDLNLDRINLDRYVPESEKQTSATSDKSADDNKAALAIVAPIPIFKELTANGMFRTENLQASGAKLDNLLIDIKSKDKQVVIKPKANLYQGTLDGKITFNEKDKESTLRIENNLQGVNFGPLLKDTDITDQISGIGDAKTDITIVDRSGKQTNDGNISLVVKDGALKGINVKKILDESQDKIDSLRGKAVDTKPVTEDETQFAEIAANLKLNNNVLTNNDLNIKAPAFRVGGKGKISLEPQTLDYTTSVFVVNTNKGQGGKDREDLKGLVIPVKFYGNLTSPEYKIDFRSLVKANTEKTIDRKQDELRQKAAEKLGLTDKSEGKQVSEKELKEELKKKLLDKLFN